MSLMNKVYFLAKICIDNMKTECTFKSAVSKYVFCGHDICAADSAVIIFSAF